MTLDGADAWLTALLEDGDGGITASSRDAAHGCVRRSAERRLSLPAGSRSMKTSMRFGSD